MLVAVGCCYPLSHNLGGMQQEACASPRLWVYWRSAGSAGSSASSWCPAGLDSSADKGLGCSTQVHSRAQTEEGSSAQGKLFSRIWQRHKKALQKHMMLLKAWAWNCCKQLVSFTFHWPEWVTDPSPRARRNIYPAPLPLLYESSCKVTSGQKVWLPRRTKNLGQ